jgi:hypothetical protein
VRRGIEHIDHVGVLGSDVGAAAVGQKADSARPVADLDRFDHLALCNVDDVDAVRFLCAHVEPLAIGAPHGMLRILASRLDLAIDGELGRVDEEDLIVLLDGGGQPLAVGER